MVRPGPLWLSRPGVRAGLVLLTCLVVFSAWLLVRGSLAQAGLREAREHLEVVRAAVQRGDAEGARTALAAARRETDRARQLTDDTLWRASTHLPLVGRSTAAAATVASAAHDLTRTVLPPLLRAGESLDLATLRRGAGLELAPVRAVQPQLLEVQKGVARVRERVEGIDGALAGPVATGVAALRDELITLADAVDLALRVSRLLPPVLGADGPRSYLLVVQNPAEARGTGGLLGAYGIVDARAGQVTIREIGPNSALRDARRVPVDLGSDFAELYGEDPALWVNANLSPHFPYAARIWLALWERQFGEQLDGVLSVDPVALGYLVGASGPVRLADGTRLTGATTADFIMRDVYRRYPAFADSTVREQLLAQLGADIVARVLAEDTDVTAVAAAARRGVTTGRVSFYSVRPGEQADLAGTRLGGVLRRTEAPRLHVVVNNGAANKLDYYLGRSVRWELGACTEGWRRSRVEITLRNGAPASGLPTYVTGNVDRPRNGVAIPRGTNRALVSVFSTARSRLTGAELDDVELVVRQGRERGHPVTTFSADLPPGGTRRAVLEFREPATSAPARIVDQPLVLPQRSVVISRSCEL